VPLVPDTASLSDESPPADALIDPEPSDLQGRLYTPILSTTPDLAYVFDLAHRIIYANDALLKMWGVSWDEAIGKNYHELGYDERQAEQHDREIAEVIATGKPVHGEAPYTAAAGRRFYDYIFAPVLDGNARVEAVAGTARDVTERVTEQLRVSLLARTAELARTVSDPDELLSSVATAVGEYFGVRRCYFNEVDLTKGVEIIHRDYSNEVNTIAGEHRISGYSEITSTELALGETVVNRDTEFDPRTARLFTSSYNPRKERASIAVPLMREGRWVSTLCVVDDGPREWTESDVTVVQIIAERAWLALETIRSESARKESEERFSKAFNSSPMAITITSLKTGRLLEVNDTFENITGYSRAEAVGCSTAELGLWARDDDRDAELSAVVTEKAIRDREYRFLMKDGSEVIGLLSAELIEIGGEACALTVIQDITGRVRAEDEVKKAALRYRNLFESIDEGFCLIEILFDQRGEAHDYRYIEINPAFERQSGMRNVVGRTFAEIAPDDPKYWVRLFAGVEATGESIRLERRVDTTGKWFDIYAFRVDNQGGRQVAMLFSDITLRKRTEAALRESEGRFRLVANAAPVLIWSANSEKERNWFNKSWLDFTGKQLEEELGLGWLNGIHPEDKDRYLRTFDDAFSSRSDFEIEYRLKRADGEFRWLLDKGIPRTEPDGHFSGYIGSCIDITDRKLAEEALLASQAEIELVFERTPFMLAHCSSDLRYKYVSRSYASMFGHEPREFVNVSIPDIIGSERFQASRSKIEAVLQGDPVAYESSLEIKNSGRRYLDVSYVPVKENDGKVSGWIESIVDISERKAAEGLLERYRLLSEETNDIIWFIRPDGSFVDVNRSAAEAYGYTREEFLSINLEDIRHPETLSELPSQLQHANREGHHFETFHVRKDGSVFPVEVKANGGDFGGERLIMSIIRDITERKTAERELLSSEERRQMAEEAGNVGIWDWDVVKGRTYWSESMWNFYGEKPGDVNPDEKYWSSHLHPNDRDRVKANLHNVVESADEYFRDEFRIVRHDGTVKWIEAKARVTRDEANRATRVCGVNLDITERKETEERVRLSEYQLRVVTNAVPALISYVDRKERYRFVNHKYIEWFNRRPDELIGKKVKDIVGAAAYRELKPRIDEALVGVESTFETALTYKNAGTRYVHVSLVPDIGIDGIVHGYYGLTHDLTDLKQSEDLLRSSEERMGMLMENFTDYAIFSMNVESLIDTWNKGAEIIFGYSQAEAIGMSGDLLFTPEDIAGDIPALERNTARKKGRSSDERWHLRKDGTRFFASGVTMPLYIGKRLSGYAKIASDLTEKKKHAEELQRAHDELEMRVKERTKELAESNLALVTEMEEREVAERQRIDLLRRLVSSQELERRRIARDLHDQLGQRLTALRLKIASLKDLTPSSTDFNARVQRLQEIAERLDSEVSFLAWELRPSALDDLGLSDAIGAFVHEWSKHYEIPADFYATNLGDERLNREAETHLYRISQEALNNIAKHAKASQVTAILERRGDNVILIIEDNGVGFEPAKEKVPSESGKGLGLVGMRERALLVGGSVEFESAPGKGSTIYVKVPFIV
jgi:PAS domain S-box-containing protein